MFFRRRGEFYSIEGLFDAVISHLPAGMTVNARQVPEGGAGMGALFGNCLWSRRRQGDINHITGDINYIAGVLEPNKTILTIHDVRPLLETRGPRRLFIKYFWFDMPCERATAVTVVSENTRSELLEHVRVDPKKIVVIPDCVSSRYRYSERRFDEERPVLLQVGTTTNKNVLRLTEALHGLACRLVVVGHPRPELERALRANRIDYEFRYGLSPEEMADVYASCDMVVFPSLYEGFGLPIVEGNAVGRPVVTSNVSSMPEIAGDAALFVDPLSVASIRDGIRAVIHDRELREQLVKNGLQNIERFRPEGIAAKYADLYARVSRKTISHRPQSDARSIDRETAT